MVLEDGRTVVARADSGSEAKTARLLAIALFVSTLYSPTLVSVLLLLLIICLFTLSMYYFDTVCRRWSALSTLTTLPMPCSVYSYLLCLRSEILFCSPRYRPEQWLITLE